MRFHILLLAIISGLLSSCSVDNYTPPTIKFTGHIVYQGESINVQNSSGDNIDNSTVYFYLYEPGWQKSDMPIKVVVNQDGSFSSLLFGANYKMVMPVGVGPYKASTDTMDIDVTKSDSMNIDVTPYYMVRNPSFAMSDSIVNASFKLEQIITGANAKNVQAVYLYINRLVITDGGNNIAFSEMDGANITDMNNIQMSVKMPSLASLGLGISTDQSYIFARIGVQIEGVRDLLFSPVQKINIQ